MIAEYVTRPLSFAGHEARISALNDVTARFEAEQDRSLLAAIVESSNDAIVSQASGRHDHQLESGQLSAFSATPGQRSSASRSPPWSRTIRPHEEADVMRQIAAGNSLTSFEDGPASQGWR